MQADIVLVGHTHLPFTMRLEKQRIVNPGSVGQPKHGSPMACYALWEDGDVYKRQLLFHADHAQTRAQSGGNLDRNIEGLARAVGAVVCN